ncbi:MAG TPA: RNA-processing protein [Methanosarcinales archaeon]|nr:RNA-processing protein [Methanosarcinales archaeon]
MYVKIPHDRIGAVIGPKGSVKQLIEELSTATLDIDSKSGTVEVLAPDEPVRAMQAVEVVKAIGRGFSPERAIVLFDDDFLVLEVINIPANTPKELKRIKGRIIGTNGRTRELIETVTHVSVSIYGKTVSIIGYPEQTHVAKTAIGMLIDGAPHSSVYSYVEKKRRELAGKQAAYH